MSACKRCVSETSSCQPRLVAQTFESPPMSDSRVGLCGGLVLMDELNRFGTAFQCPRFISMLRTFVSALCRCQHWLSYAINNSGFAEACAAVASRLLTAVLTYKKRLLLTAPFLHVFLLSPVIIAPFFLFISFFLLFTLLYFFPPLSIRIFTPSLSSHSPIFINYSLSTIHPRS